MNKIMVLIGTIFLIIAMVMQCIGTMQFRGSLEDQIDALKDMDDKDLEDAYDDEISARTTLGIALATFMLAFIFVFIGFALPITMYRTPQYPPPPPRKQFDSYDEYGNVR